MDEELRVYERALRRSGRDPVEVAREILRAAEPRFYVLTEHPIAPESSRCHAVENGRKTGDWGWRTPIWTRDDYSDVFRKRSWGSIAFTVWDSALCRWLGSPEIVVDVVEGWGGMDLSRACDCGACREPLTPQQVLARSFGRYLPSSRDQGVPDPGGRPEGRGIVGRIEALANAREFREGDVIEIPPLDPAEQAVLERFRRFQAEPGTPINEPDTLTLVVGSDAARAEAERAGITGDWVRTEDPDGWRIDVKRTP